MEALGILVDVFLSWVFLVFIVVAESAHNLQEDTILGCRPPGVEMANPSALLPGESLLWTEGVGIHMVYEAQPWQRARHISVRSNEGLC